MYWLSPRTYMVRWYLVAWAFTATLLAVIGWMLVVWIVVMRESPQTIEACPQVRTSLHTEGKR